MNFRIPGKRVLLGAALAGVVALATGGPAVADVIFDFSPPVHGTKRYYAVITAKHSGLRLNVPEASTKNGTQIIQWANNKDMNGLWETVNNPGMSGSSIRNRWSRQCLDVASTAAGAPVIQQPCDGTISQQWKSNSEQEAGDAFFRNYRNVWSGLDLNVEGGIHGAGRQADPVAARQGRAERALQRDRPGRVPGRRLALRQRAGTRARRWRAARR